MRRLFWAPALVALLAASVPGVQAQAPDQPLLGGRFYTQGSSRAGLGYGVVDDGNAPFFTELERLGGPAVTGFPISRRFTFNGVETQVFQRLVMQATANGVQLLATLDELSAAGKDETLNGTYGVPAIEDLSGTDPLAVLEESPAIKEAYYSVVSDPAAVFGLPTSRIVDYGDFRSVRLQRVAIHERAGAARIVNAGEIARDTTLFPAAPFQPQSLAQAASDRGESTGPAVSVPTVEPVGGGSASRDQLKVTAVTSTRTPTAGTPFRVNARITDSAGRPLAGAIVIAILHYPLKDANSAYAVDGVFSAPSTDEGGNTSVLCTVDPAVPSGVVLTLEVSAVYPPSAGRAEIDLTVS